MDPRIQLDPALFSSPQNGANANQAIDVSTPERIPIAEVADMTPSSSSSISSTSAASSNTVHAYSTQRTTFSSLSSPSGINQKPTTTAEPLLQPSEPSLATSANVAPTISSASSSSSAKSQPPLHPFFKPGSGTTQHPEANQESETDHKRPARSTRTKAPVSYKEDLKAVLRADKAQEAARLKEEKRLKQLENKPQRSSGGGSGKANVGDGGKGKEQKEHEGTTDEFELVEARVATPKKSVARTTMPAVAESSSSKQQPITKPVVVEPKPLSLAVKGTGVAASANPHPFFSKKPKQAPPPTPQEEIDTVLGQEEHLPSSDDKGKGKAPTARSSTSSLSAAPAAWSLFAAPRATSSKPKKPLQALWPTGDDTHIVGLRDTEAELLSHARSDLSTFRSRWQPRATSSKTVYEDPPADFVARLNRSRTRTRTRTSASLRAISLTGTEETFNSIDDYLSQHVDISSLPPSFSLSDGEPSAFRTSGQLWIDAHRPHTASSCLGNESNATFLLEWLRRLLVSAPAPAPTAGIVGTGDKKRKKQQQQQQQHQRGIVRRVDRKKKRRRRGGGGRGGYSDDDESDDDLADFIVDDDDEEEEEEEEWDESVTDEEWFSRFARIDRKSTATDFDDEDGAIPPPALSALEPNTNITTAAAVAATGVVPQRQKDQRFPSLERLTNCIVLEGPCGSGKTASVYACASELGYEVFELYPGMGKRSGKELLSAVGDLGRNHMVSSGGIGGGATFKKPPSSISTTSTNPASSVRQSLILIEEADLLFDEDKGFWPAVVELVSESKRPVVIVCNDLELVPVGDLPVQEVLHFSKPVLGKVVPLLQTVAAYHDRYLPSDTVRQMLLGLPGTQLALSQIKEEEEENHLGVDLRQALHQLQFGFSFSSCFSSDEIREEEVQDDALQKMIRNGVGLKDIVSAAESRSLGDVFETLLMGVGEEMEFSWGQAGGGGVEALAAGERRQLGGGWIQLSSQPLQRLQQSWALVGSAKVDYAGTFDDIQMSLADCEDVGQDGVPLRMRISDARMKELHAQEAHRIQTLLYPLHNLHRFTLTSSHLPSANITDYAPFVRLMTLVDDDLARIHVALHQQENTTSSPPPIPSGRSTRNSTRLTSWLSRDTPGYERWLNMGPEQVSMARLTSLTF
ncbi:uncharacterized protein UTRI_06558_B [Ustilago trichophora]|uniref:AAA+ ATPase domain-containing protein n=1 Tax=Ustilago trichophora TaxID=86804 RepID=A0A5C3ENR9_9BASI|nr:uncharacterized protein UTRI_06558_B [Ustilago trichophora]